MSIASEFKDFISRGNVVDLAVAVVIGAAFKGVIDSFSVDVIGGLIAAVGGQPDLSDLTVTIGEGVIYYGRFLNSIINFLIVGFALFLVVKAINRAQSFRRTAAEEDALAETEVDLLRQIRDELATRN